MPKSKSKMTKGQMMKRLRQQRKDAGLVEFRVWVSPEDYRVLVAIVADIEYYRPIKISNPSS